MAYLHGTFEERCHTTGAPSYLSFFTASLSIAFLATNIPGNLLLILAVALDPHKNLRSPFNYLMANLAVADLIAGVVTGPLSVNYHIREGLYGELSLEEITVFHISYFISCTASVLSLASLATERYLAIRNPHTYRNKLTGTRVLFTILGIWSISLTLPFIYIEVGFITCAFILANTTVFLALGIMCFTYGLMIWKLKMNNRLRSTARSESEIGQLNINNQEGDVKSRGQDKTVRTETRITKMFLVVMAAVICCYGPSAILIYIMSFCESCSCESLHWFRDLQCMFVLANSSMNFFCYALRSSRFRQAFVAILRLKKRDMVGNSLSVSPSSENNTMRTIHKDQRTDV